MGLFDAVLLTATAWVVIATALLLVAGRRPAGIGWRAIGALATGAISLMAATALGGWSRLLRCTRTGR